MAGRGDDRHTDPAEWRTAGERIEELLDAASAGGPVGRERAEQLVREVAGLYGAALRRMITLSGDAPTVERYAADDLVASLLLVHGLHPHDVHRRVTDALDRVRPYLGSHGGDVELIGVGDDGVVRLRLTGSCKSCPSSSVTLELAVEDAVRAAAPEVTGIEVAADVTTEPTVIAPGTLLDRVHAAAVWHPVPELAGLEPGEVGGFAVGDTVVLACRIGDELFAYRDHCPSCDGSLAGAALHRLPGSRGVVLRCPRCRAHYDVVRAGAGLDDPDRHLAPLPLLLRDGVLSLAVRDQPAGLSA